MRPSINYDLPYKYLLSKFLVYESRSLCLALDCSYKFSSILKSCKFYEFGIFGWYS